MNSKLNLSVSNSDKELDVENVGICDTTIYDAKSDILYDVAPRVDTIRELDWKEKLTSISECERLPYEARGEYTFNDYTDVKCETLMSKACKVMCFKEDSKFFTKEAFVKRLSLMTPYLKTLMHPADRDRLFVNMYQLNLAAIRFNSVFDDVCKRFERVSDATDADVDAKILAVRKTLPASRKTLLWHLVGEDVPEDDPRRKNVYFSFTGSPVKDNTLLMNAYMSANVYTFNGRISDNINKNGIVPATDVSRCLRRFIDVREMLQSALGEDIDIRIGEVEKGIYSCFSLDNDTLEGSIRPDIGISGTTDEIDTLKTLMSSLDLEFKNPVFIFEEETAQEIAATREMYSLFGDDSAVSAHYGALMYTAWCASQRYISKKWRGWSSARDWQRLADAKDLVAELKKVDIYGAYTSQLDVNILITSGGFVSVTLDEKNNIVGAELLPLSSVCPERGWSEDAFINMLFDVPKNLAAWAKNNGLKPGISDDLIKNKTSWAWDIDTFYKNFDSLTRMTGRARLAYSMMFKAYNWWLYKEGQVIWSNLGDSFEITYNKKIYKYEVVPTVREHLPGVFAVSEYDDAPNTPNHILSKRMNRVTPDSFYGTPYSWDNVPDADKSVHLAYGDDSKFHFANSNSNSVIYDVFSPLLEIMSAMDELTTTGTPLDIKSLKLKISEDDFVAIIAEPSFYCFVRDSRILSENANFKERFEMPGYIERLCKKFPEEYREKYKTKLAGRERIVCDCG